MLPRAHRMRRGADFTTTTRSGARASRGHVVAYVHRSGGEPALVGLIVGRVVGPSVARHRVSRRLRAALAGIVTELPSDSWVVVRALAGAQGDPELPADAIRAVRAAAERAALVRT